jgi:PadR family transcriptional regulator PadR
MPSRITLPSCEGRFFQVDILPGRADTLGYMSTQDAKERLELLQGTLDLLILRTLIFGSQHGQGIARAIQQTSQEELLVEHGALYPALQRLEERGWISAKWGISSNNRKARFYALTAAGRKQLVKETNKWKRLTGAIARILGPEEA